MEATNTKVLVTGGAGFVGHHLVKQLLLLGYSVVSLDRLDFAGNLNRLAELRWEVPEHLHKNLRVVYHDLKAHITPQLKQQIGPVDFIVHMAAGSHVNRSIEDPVLFVQDNVLGTCNLLEYARTLPNLQKFVNFGTDEVFGSAPSGVDFKEYDRYNSRSPYSATKAGAEELCVAYENTYGVPVYCTHTMNVYGERQQSEKFIGIIIRKLLAKEPVTIHADPETGTKSGLRHWIHAEDVAKAVLFILNLPHKGFPLADPYFTTPKFNIVGSSEISNLQVAEMVAKIMGVPLEYKMVSYDLQRPGHDFRYSLSGEYMQQLGWTPKINFDEGLTKMVKWTLNHKHWL